MEDVCFVSFDDVLTHFPGTLFSLGYIALIGNVLLNCRSQRSLVIKGLVLLMLGSQAFQLWKYIHIFVHALTCQIFGEAWNTLELHILWGLAMLPLLANILKLQGRRRRQRQALTWRSRGPRSEMGVSGYYLSRPVSPEKRRSVRLTRTRSLTDMVGEHRRREHRPKSAQTEPSTTRYLG